MTLEPIFAAPLAIQTHIFAATGAFILGLLQIGALKGTFQHRTIGWIWIVLMVAVCITAFFIHEIRLWGVWSPIHLLAVVTMAVLPIAVLHARRHNIERHRRIMIATFFGALMVAGAFTFLPNRIMNTVLFGM